MPVSSERAETMSFFIHYFMFKSNTVLNHSCYSVSQSQHARLPCPWSSPGVWSNSCLLIWWCHPPFNPLYPLLLLLSIFSSIRAFCNELAFCIRWPKYWSFSLSISLSNEYLGLFYFRIDWFDLLAVGGTLQHHSSKASILPCSAFFYGPMFRSIHAYWKNHSFDYMDFRWQSNVCFLIWCLVLSIGMKTRKGQFSFQFQRKAMPNYGQIPTQLHSSHTLAK